jgi:hypothetical protein
MYNIILFSLISLSIIKSPDLELVKQDTIQGPQVTREKLFLHTDRDAYFKDEILWYKVYLVEALTGQLTDFSNNIHIELISPDLKIIESKIIRVENGIGNGDISLPKYLASGNYILRGYTNSMRNCGNILFFAKRIRILNSYEKSLVGSTKPEKGIRINFFPEGGTLVNNISSTVVFKATDNLGKGYNCEGDIFSSDGTKVTDFKSLHSGLGSFILKPIGGLSYFAVIKNVTGEDIRYDLPKSIGKGVSIHYEKEENGKLIFIIKTNVETFPLITGRDLFLEIKDHNTLVQSIRFKINSLFNRLEIPENDLQPGIIQFTLSAGNSFPLCQRLIFNPNRQNIEPVVELKRIGVENEDSILIKIGIKSDSIIDPTAFVSISVTRNCDDFSSYYKSMASWFLLDSEIRGTIEDPAYFFDEKNPDRTADLDLLLCTRSSRDFICKYDSLRFLRENGFSVSGRINNLYGKSKIGKTLINIGLLSENSTVFTKVFTDETGRFKLSGIDLVGEALVTARLSKTGDNYKYKILFDSIQYTPPQVENINEISVEDSFQDHHSIRTITPTLDLPALKYKLSDTIRLPEIKVTGQKIASYDPQIVKVTHDRQLYGLPDNEVIITPQNEFLSNAFEVLAGKVPGVYVTGTSPNINIVIRGPGTVNGGPSPLFLLDGARVSKEEILDLPVYSIDRIDVLKGGSTANFGMKGGAGVIAVITKTGNRPLERKQPSTVTVNKIKGYDLSRTFYPTEYETNVSNEANPGKIQTLIWEPDIILENNQLKSIKFKNPGPSSSIEIRVEGVTSSGVPFSKSILYKEKMVP